MWAKKATPPPESGATSEKASEPELVEEPPAEEERSGELADRRLELRHLVEEPPRR
jgi:hypothetical protein